MKYLISIVFLSLIGCTTQAEICSRSKVSIKMNSSILVADTACTMEQQKNGLMHIRDLDKDNGMIFVFDKSQYLSFWMKDTVIPLSIAFVNKDFIIVDIREMKPLDLTPINSKEISLYAIEANQYWFSQHDIKIGDKILIQ